MPRDFPSKRVRRQRQAYLNVAAPRYGKATTEIDCKMSSVPAALIPAKIKQYVKSTYPGAKIIQIEVDASEYEVKLSNRLEVTFNKSFQVIDIDD